MPQAKIPIEDNLFEALLGLGKLLGMNRSIASVFAVLYSHDAPCTIDEIATLGNLSKSAVSLALRDLTYMGIVQELGILGERCRHYCGQPHLAETVIDLIVARLSPAVLEVQARLDQVTEASPRRNQMQELVQAIDSALAHMQNRT